MNDFKVGDKVVFIGFDDVYIVEESDEHFVKVIGTLYPSYRFKLYIPPELPPLKEYE